MAICLSPSHNGSQLSHLPRLEVPIFFCSEAPGKVVKSRSEELDSEDRLLPTWLECLCHSFFLSHPHVHHTLPRTLFYHKIPTSDIAENTLLALCGEPANYVLIVFSFSELHPRKNASCCSSKYGTLMENECALDHTISQSEANMLHTLWAPRRKKSSLQWEDLEPRSCMHGKGHRAPCSLLFLLFKLLLPKATCLLKNGNKSSLTEAVHHVQLAPWFVVKLAALRIATWQGGIRELAKGPSGHAVPWILSANGRGSAYQGRQGHHGEFSTGPSPPATWGLQSDRRS